MRGSRRAARTERVKFLGRIAYRLLKVLRSLGSSSSEARKAIAEAGGIRNSRRAIDDVPSMGIS